uniref:Uncharacterized protein n=1 Tax=Moniliophthora roreri TaxID=221103 RepID=A0A0W0FWS3_MONRR
MVKADLPVGYLGDLISGLGHLLENLKQFIGPTHYKDERYHARTNHNHINGPVQARRSADAISPTDLTIFLWKRARAERLELPIPEFRLLSAQNPVTSNNGDEVGPTGLDEEVGRSLSAGPSLSDLEEPQEAREVSSRSSPSLSSDGKSDEEFDGLFDDNDENAAQTTISPATSWESTAWLSNVSKVLKGDEEVPASDDEEQAEVKSVRQDSPRGSRISSSPSHLRPSLSTREAYEIVPESPTPQPAAPLFTPPSSPTFSEVEAEPSQRNVALNHDTDSSPPSPPPSRSNQEASSSTSKSSPLFTPFPAPREDASKSLANDDETAGVGDSSGLLFDEQYTEDWDEQETSGHGTPLFGSDGEDDFVDDPMQGENDSLYPMDADTEGKILNERSSSVNNGDREEEDDAMAVDEEPGEQRNDNDNELRPPEIIDSVTALGNPIIVGTTTKDEVDILDDGELRYPTGAVDDDDDKHSNAGPSSFGDDSHDERFGIAYELLEIESSSNGSPLSRRLHLQVDSSELPLGWNELQTPASLLDENPRSADVEPVLDHLEELDRASVSNVSLEDGEIREKASLWASNNQAYRERTSEALGLSAIDFPLAEPVHLEEGELIERQPLSTINPPVASPSPPSNLSTTKVATTATEAATPLPSPIPRIVGRNFILKHTEPKQKRRRKADNDAEPAPLSKKQRVDAISNTKSAKAPPGPPKTTQSKLPSSYSFTKPQDLQNSFDAITGPSRPRVIKTVTLTHMIEWINTLTLSNYLLNEGRAVQRDGENLATTLEEIIAGKEDIVNALREQVRVRHLGKGRRNQGKPTQAQKLVEVLHDHERQSGWGESVQGKVANLLEYFHKEEPELVDILGA